MGKILIVDDSRLMRAQLKDMLKNAGHDVVGESGNGKDAIKKYRELRPDMVLMDVIMPNENGIEATKDIMELDPEARILLMSTDNQTWRVREAVIAGGKGYIRKPFKEEDLLEKVRVVLEGE